MLDKGVILTRDKLVRVLQWAGGLPDPDAQASEALHGSIVRVRISQKRQKDLWMTSGLPEKAEGNRCRLAVVRGVAMPQIPDSASGANGAVFLDLDFGDVEDVVDWKYICDDDADLQGEHGFLIRAFARLQNGVGLHRLLSGAEVLRVQRRLHAVLGAASVNSRLNMDKSSTGQQKEQQAQGALIEGQPSIISTQQSLIQSLQAQLSAKNRELIRQHHATVQATEDGQRRLTEAADSHAAVRRHLEDQNKLLREENEALKRQFETLKLQIEALMANVRLAKELKSVVAEKLHLPERAGIAAVIDAMRQFQSR
jgi:hypothetical protein